jgi:4-hydroxybutyrate CoA-transferase
MNVAIKYCGGCDPAFDRVEMAERIKIAADNAISWCSVHERHRDIILLICGCPKACPFNDLKDESKVVLLTSDDAPLEGVIAEILKKGKAHENQDER